MDSKDDLSWAHELMEAIIEDESKSIGDNEIAVHRMDKCESILRKTVKGGEVSIISKKNDPVPSMGVISVMGKEIKFIDSQGFLSVAKLASNIDVYTENGGVARIDFTFHGLTRKGL